jgi:hypothetical protein
MIEYLKSYLINNYKYSISIFKNILKILLNIFPHPSPIILSDNVNFILKILAILQKLKKLKIKNKKIKKIIKYKI